MVPHSEPEMKFTCRPRTRSGNRKAEAGGDASASVFTLRGQSGCKLRPVINSAQSSAIAKGVHPCLFGGAPSLLLFGESASEETACVPS